MHGKQRAYHQTYKSLWVPDLACGFVHANSVFSTRISSLYGLQPSPVALCVQNRDLRPELQLSVCPRPHLWICACKTACLPLELLVSVSQTSSVDLCMQNSVLTTRITSLNVSQTSSVDLCKQNSFLSTKITSLYGSQTHLWFGAFKTVTIRPELMVSMDPRPHLWVSGCKTAPELLVSMGPRLHLWIFANKTSCLAPKLPVPMGPRPLLWFCVFKTAFLASEYQVYMGASHHLWFLRAKQRL